METIEQRNEKRREKGIETTGTAAQKNWEQWNIFKKTQKKMQQLNKEKK